MFLHGDLWARSINRRRPRAAQGVAAPVTVVADTTTIEPCFGAKFDFFTFPAISAGDIAFQGADGKQSNYRTLDGKLLCNVRPGDPAPDGGTFQVFGLPMINFGTVAFYAQTTQNNGIYSRSGTKAPLMIANTKTIVPGQSVAFTDFQSSPVVAVQQYAFIGYIGKSYTGVFVASGTALVKIADTKTPIPGGSGPFTYLSNPAISTKGVAFFGSGSGIQPSSVQAGIYFGGSGPLRTIADVNTPAPGGGAFNGFGQPAISDQLVAFHGMTSLGNEGMYAATAGQAPVVVADLNTPVPGGSGTFELFQSDPCAGDGTVAFRAYSAIGVGLYLWNGTSLSKIIDQNDTIGGQGIIYLGFGTNDIAAGEISFYAVLENKVFGIYKMPILE